MKITQSQPVVAANIPIPSKRTTPKTYRIFHFLSLLKPNDSILFDTDRDRKIAYREAERLKIEITTRKINGEGIRVWRTK